ncbi:AfsA-related hotdog domain-containing protein [Pseudomonas sp. NPDC007930]|uniref:AfsA-related hotdog domain-containing protein n=1 Tax=Pseudomonas sp. NPDC007930 TaxID=3364417 RepID=UPI0036E4F093
MEALAPPFPATPCPFAAPGAEPQPTVVVVGDRIKQQCPQAAFVNLAGAQALAAAGPATLHIGQGIDDAGLAGLYQLASEQITLVPAQPRQRAGRQATHQHHARNIVISKLVDNGNGSYASWLMIDERHGQLSDHLTGMHVPGMLIIEAARQLAIAAAEQCWLAPAARGKVNFLSHNIQVNFEQLLLPLATEIICVPLALKRSGPVNFRYSTSLHFRQHGSTLARVEIDTSVVDSRFFHLKEDQLLHRSITLLH